MDSWLVFCNLVTFFSSCSIKVTPILASCLASNVYLLIVEEPEVPGVVAMRIDVIVRRVLAPGEAGVAVAVLVGACHPGARRLQPQPWRWPWKHKIMALVMEWMHLNDSIRYLLEHAKILLCIVFFSSHYLQ